MHPEGRYQVARLPAEGDPLYERVERIRARDGDLIDTVSDYYGTFSDAVKEPYGDWRRYSFDEIVKEVGFDSRSTLFRALRRFHGVTPRECRHAAESPAFMGHAGSASAPAWSSEDGGSARVLAAAH